MPLETLRVGWRHRTSSILDRHSHAERGNEIEIGVLKDIVHLLPD
jgi:hypothetical protein